VGGICKKCYLPSNPKDSSQDFLPIHLDAEQKHNYQDRTDHTHKAKQELIEALGKKRLGDFLFWSLLVSS